MRTLFFTNVCFMFLFFGCKGQETTGVKAFGSEIPSALDSYILSGTSASFKTAKAPGILVAVSHNGSRRYYTAGFADVDLKKTFDSSTVFEAGSITKTFTAFILMNVLAEKNINDSTSIINYLPDSVRQNPVLEEISFLQLLNHSSGLPSLPDDIFTMSENPLQPYANYKKENLFSYLKRCLPQPDGGSHYSNLGYALAGTLAELISGKSYAQLLNEYITEAFGITKTGIDVPEHADIATGMIENTRAEYWNMNVFTGTGAVKSTASDLLTYMQRISNPAPAIRPVIEKLTTPTLPLNAQMKVCRGWHTIEDHGKPVIYWHNGGTYGFSTFAAFTKNDDKAVVVVINAFNKNEVSDALGTSIIQKMLR